MKLSGLELEGAEAGVALGKKTLVVGVGHCLNIDLR